MFAFCLSIAYNAGKSKGFTQGLLLGLKAAALSGRNYL